MVAQPKNAPSRHAGSDALRSLGVLHQCSTSDLVREGNKTTSKVVCTQRIAAHATMPATQTNLSGTETTILSENGDVEVKREMRGTMISGSTTTPMEMISELRNIYKGPDCGAVKPPAPAAHP
jgi:hypothetical protein